MTIVVGSTFKTHKVPLCDNWIVCMELLQVSGYRLESCLGLPTCSFWPSKTIHKLQSNRLVLNGLDRAFVKITTTGVILPCTS